MIVSCADKHFRLDYVFLREAIKTMEMELWATFFLLCAQVDPARMRELRLCGANADAGKGLCRRRSER